MIDSLWLIIPFILLSALSVQTGYNILFESQAIDAAEQAALAVAYKDQEGSIDNNGLNHTALNVFSAMSNQSAVSDHETETAKELEEAYLKYRVTGESLMTDLIWFNRVKKNVSTDKPELFGKGVAGRISSGNPGHYIFAMDTGNGYGPVVNGMDIDEYVSKWSDEIIKAGGRVTILPFNKMVFVENSLAPAPSSTPNMKRGYCVSNLVRKGLMYDLAFSKWADPGVLANGFDYNDDFGPSNRDVVKQNLVTLHGVSIGTMMDSQQYPYVADSHPSAPYVPAPSTLDYKSSTLGTPSSPFLSAIADNDIDYQKTVSFRNLTEEEKPGSRIRNRYDLAIKISDPSDGAQRTAAHPFVPYFSLSSACYSTNDSMVSEYGRINLVDGTIENTQDVNDIVHALESHEPSSMAFWGQQGNPMSYPTALSEGFIRAVQLAYKYNVKDEPNTIVMIAPPQSNQEYSNVDKKLFEDYSLCEKVSYISKETEVIFLANNSSNDMNLSLAKCMNVNFPGNSARPENWNSFMTQRISSAGGEMGIIGG
ncbi:TPA: hypothetical protein RQN76_004321 [Aeromonas dhakensis]|nr:hypothetical protein [Aeromonas dhakensis]